MDQNHIDLLLATRGTKTFPKWLSDHIIAAVGDSQPDVPYVFVQPYTQELIAGWISTYFRVPNSAIWKMARVIATYIKNIDKSYTSELGVLVSNINLENDSSIWQSMVSASRVSKRAIHAIAANESFENEPRIALEVIALAASGCLQT